MGVTPPQHLVISSCSKSFSTAKLKTAIRLFQTAWQVLLDVFVAVT